MSAKHEDSLAGGTGDGDRSVPAPILFLDDGDIPVAKPAEKTDGN